MSDYERYGDYDNTDDDLPKSKSPIILILKILIASICIGVVGLLAVRLIIFNNYPDSVKLVSFDDTLKEHYLEKNGDIEIKTQKIRAPYDDPDLGYFFSDHLYVIDGCDQLQITVRYNTANCKRISDELAIEGGIDPDSQNSFGYCLVDNYGRVYDNVTIAAFDSRSTYRYVKLIVNGVDFSPEENPPEWIRLDVYVNGADRVEPYTALCIYENHANYSSFESYELSQKERP